MNNKKVIPPEHKCSRCKKDLRSKAKAEDRCTCIKTHPLSSNKSGGRFMQTVIEYKGKGE